MEGERDENGALLYKLVLEYEKAPDGLVYLFVEQPDDPQPEPKRQIRIDVQRRWGISYAVGYWWGDGDGCYQPFPRWRRLGTEDEEIARALERLRKKLEEV